MRAWLLALLLLLPAAAQAETAYTLVYQGNNEWVAQTDAEPLRQLLKEVKVQQVTALTFARNPADPAPATDNRVLILRDILAKRLRAPFTLTEVIRPEVPRGQMVVFVP